MADWAVDTNILVKWVIQEPDSNQADALAAAVTASGDALIALDLALVEAANSLCTLVRRSLLPAVEAIRLFGLLASRPVRIVSAHPLLPQAIDEALRHGIAVYDALFVALTADLGVGGVTADEPLYKAVRINHPQIQLLRNWSAPPASGTP